MGVFLHAVGCWELAKSLAKATARKDSKQTPDPRPSPRDLSLTDSALTRAASRHIGRGASSALLQEFASAAIESPVVTTCRKAPWPYTSQTASL